MRQMFRKVLPTLIVGAVAVVAAVPSGAMGAKSSKTTNSTPTNPPTHREAVCHRTGSGYVVIPPAKASSHIDNQTGEKTRGHEGDFLLEATYPDDDRKWPEVKASYQRDCDSHVVVPAAPTKSDLCGTASDTYSIPSTRGVIYKVDDVVTSAGTYAGTGRSSSRPSPIRAT